MLRCSRNSKPQEDSEHAVGIRDAEREARRGSEGTLDGRLRAMAKESKPSEIALPPVESLRWCSWFYNGHGFYYVRFCEYSNPAI